jgi:hypothetical protein
MGDLAGTYFFSVSGFGPGGELLAAGTIALENGAVIRGATRSVLRPDGIFTTTVDVV